VPLAWRKGTPPSLEAPAVDPVDFISDPAFMRQISKGIFAPVLGSLWFKQRPRAARQMGAWLNAITESKQGHAFAKEAVDLPPVDVYKKWLERMGILNKPEKQIFFAPELEVGARIPPAEIASAVRYGGRIKPYGPTSYRGQQTLEQELPLVAASKERPWRITKDTSIVPPQTHPYPIELVPNKPFHGLEGIMDYASQIPELNQWIKGWPGGSGFHLHAGLAPGELNPDKLRTIMRLYRNTENITYPTTPYGAEVTREEFAKPLNDILRDMPPAIFQRLLRNKDATLADFAREFKAPGKRYSALNLEHVDNPDLRLRRVEDRSQWAGPLEDVIGHATFWQGLMDRVRAAKTSGLWGSKPEERKIMWEKVIQPRKEAIRAERTQPWMNQAEDPILKQLDESYWAAPRRQPRQRHLPGLEVTRARHAELDAELLAIAEAFHEPLGDSLAVDWIEGEVR